MILFFEFKNAIVSDVLYCLIFVFPLYKRNDRNVAYLG